MSEPWWTGKSDVGDAARYKIMAAIGDSEWHSSRERVRRVVPITVVNAGVAERMFVIYTESAVGRGGAPRTGRILLAFEPDGTQLVGGLFWFEEHGVKKLQSAYFDDDFRRGRASSLLIKRAKKMGIRVAVGPYSPAGKRFVERHAFILEEEPGLYE